jgi:metal-responsive CopG/Arc/MetJ family transcriptional regulator
MPKKTEIQIRVTETLKEKIRKDSKEFYGKENMSGWICHLSENFQQMIEDAFDEAIDDEYNHHINCSDRIYMNGRDYFEKTFKNQTK